MSVAGMQTSPIAHRRVVSGSQSAIQTEVVMVASVKKQLASTTQARLSAHASPIATVPIAILPASAPTAPASGRLVASQPMVRIITARDRHRMDARYGIAAATGSSREPTT